MVLRYVYCKNYSFFKKCSFFMYEEQRVNIEIFYWSIDCVLRRGCFLIFHTLQGGERRVWKEKEDVDSRNQGELESVGKRDP